MHQLSSDEWALAGADVYLRLGGSLPEENTQKDHHLRPPRLRRRTITENLLSSGEHSLTGAELAGAVCLPMSALLIGADCFLRLGVCLPEENTRKDDHLRPLRLRRSTITENLPSSGEHSLTGAELAGAVCLPMSTPLIGADDHLRLEVSRRRKTSIKTITSDHIGFAGVRLPQKSSPPASLR